MFDSYTSLAYSCSYIKLLMINFQKNLSMIFIETPIFTEEISKYLSVDEFKEFQTALLVRPESGKLIQGSGGLRKIRWKMKKVGKRGGLRIIYYWDEPNETFYLLFPYRKSKTEDLSKKEIRILSNLVTEYLL